jgi:hypothetical protein
VTSNNRDNSTRLKRNLTLYKSGKTDFSTEELSELKLYLLKYKDIVSTTEFYEGYLKSYKIISCFAEDLFTELQDYMLKKFNADIAITVVIKERKIIFKCNKERCKIDLCTLAKLLCDGNCIDETGSIAEGVITDKFLNLTKTFKQCI